MRTPAKLARRLRAASVLAVLLSASGLGPVEAGPKRDAALQDCKNIYEEQQKHCIGSSNYAACMTMITEKYESCRAEADTIVGLNAGQPKPQRAWVPRLTPLTTAIQQ
jgi:hypothetical protein